MKIKINFQYGCQNVFIKRTNLEEDGDKDDEKKCFWQMYLSVCQQIKTLNFESRIWLFR